MDFRTIEVLIWLVKDPNLKRTAERLKVTQPTLTKRLVQLEAHVGQKLFVRRGVLGMEPTAHAIELAAHAKTMLESWSYATNLVQMKSSEKPYVSMNGPSLFMQSVVAPLWAKSDLRSHFMIHIRTSPVVEINHDVSGKDLDAAFLFDRSQAMDFKSLQVCNEQMAVIYNVNSKVKPSSILSKKEDGLNWLSYRPDRDPLKHFINAGILPTKNTAGYFEDLTALLNVVSQDESFATVLPLHSILYNPGKLRGIPLKGFTQPIYYVYRPGGEREKFLREFGHYIAEELKGSPYFV